MKVPWQSSASLLICLSGILAKFKQKKKGVRVKNCIYLCIKNIYICMALNASNIAAAEIYRQLRNNQKQKALFIPAAATLSSKQGNIWAFFLINFFLPPPALLLEIHSVGWQVW